MDMPKVIADIKDKLLIVAKDILVQEGYERLSMRRVASRCEVAVGTIYNYFPNKEALLAGIMADDWVACIEQIRTKITNTMSFEEGMVTIYDSIAEFIVQYRQVWLKAVPRGESSANRMKYHPILRGQIEELIMTLGNNNVSEVLRPLLAEAILAAALQADIQSAAVRELGKLCADAYQNK